LRISQGDASGKADSTAKRQPAKPQFLCYNSAMPANVDQRDQVEGKWDELIQNPDRFAGRRVRVTVLSDDKTADASMASDVRRWLAEGMPWELHHSAMASPTPLWVAW
jgi:hypothetical protein